MAKFAQINKPQATLPQQADAPYRAPWSHRISSALLAAIFTVYVTIPSYAGSIQVDAAAAAANQADLTTARNGTQIINIVTPNGAGISHNKFIDFNVNSGGIVINNSSAVGVSNLAGAMLNNPNLASGNEARLILNEVTGASTSALNGPTEIFGRSAEYILANPNGITCNGCGFINTPRATLTTGTPNFAASGNLSSLYVNQGHIAIEGLGADASSADILELVARSVKINAAVKGNEVKVVSGRNDYVPSTGEVTPLADDGSSKPILAIDSTAVGGLYANRIALIATEAGVGVRMDGELATSGSDLVITADGQINLKSATSAGNADIKTNDALVIGDALDVSKIARLDVGTIHLASGTKITAGNDLSLKANTADIDGELSAGAPSSTDSSASLNIEATDTLSVDGTLTSQGSITLSANQLTTSGDVSAGTSATLSANTITATGSVIATDIVIDASQDATLTGQFDATSASSASAGHDLDLASSGRLSGQSVNLSADNDLDVLGEAHGTASLGLIAAKILTAYAGAKLKTGGVLSLSGSTVVNSSELKSADNLTVTATDSIINNDLIYSSQSITLEAPTIINNEAAIVAVKDIILSGTSGASAVEITNNAGTIETSHGDIRMTADAFRNIGTLSAADVTPEEIYNEYFPMVGGVARPPCPLHPVACKGEYWRGTAKVPDPRPGKTGYGYYGTSSGGGVRSIVYEQRLNTATGSKGSIHSGRDLIITADTIENKVSSLSATNDIALTGGSLLNEGLMGTGYWQINVSNGTTTRSYSDTGTPNVGFGNGGGSSVLDTWSIELMPSNIEAGGSITGDFTDQINNSSIREGYVGTTPTYMMLVDSYKAEGMNWGKDENLPQSREALSSHLASTIPAFRSLYDETSGANNFLYETRFEYTDQGTFYGSDYFISATGFDPAVNIKRIGDDFFDTQFVRNQVMKETGRRWLDNTQTNDAQQMKRLIDNAASVVGDLNLSFGITLTENQIAALTKDIVWYEKQIIDGEEILVPHLYLASVTKDKIKLNGTVIAAADAITLNAKNLVNAEGRIESGGNLTVVAAKDISSASGTLMAADDASLTAGQDITISTQITTIDDGGRNKRDLRVADSTVTVDGSLTLDAGRNVSVVGSEMTVTQNMNIKADGDINLLATVQNREEGEGDGKEGRELQARTHHLSQINVNGSSSLAAGKDINIIGANVSSGGNNTLDAENAVTIAAVTDTYSAKSWVKKSKSSASGEVATRTVQQSSVTSGADLSSSSGKNTEISASKLKADGSLTIIADGSVGLSAQADTHYEKQDSERSSWFGESSKKETVNKISHQVSALHAGNDVKVIAQNGDIAMEATRIKAGKSVEIKAEHGAVGLLSTKDVDYYALNKEGNSLVWQSMQDKGHNDETVNMVKIDAGGGLTITAGNGIVVEYRDGNASLDDTIARLSQEPGLEWMAELRARDDINWNAVAEIHDSWDYKSQGLSGPAAAVIAIAIAIATYGAGAQLGAMAGLSVGTTAAPTMAGVVANAAFTSVVAQASLSLINNQGNLGAVLKDLGSSQALVSLATAMVTAGVLHGIGGTEFIQGLKTPVTDPNLLTLAQKAQNALVDSLARSAVNTATDVIISGHDLDDALKSALLSTVAGVIGQVAAQEISSAYKDAIDDGVDPIEYVAHKIAHAAVGCASGAIASGNCAGGAIGGAAGEVISGAYTSQERVKAFEAELNAQINNKTLTQNEAIALLSDWRQQGVDLAKLGAALTAFVAGADVNTAAKAGENAAENNGASIAIPIAGAAAGAAGSTVIIVGGIPILLGGLAQLANEDTTLEDAVYAEEGGDREGIEDYNADQQNASNNSGASNNNQNNNDDDPQTAKGTANAATGQKLKDDLLAQMEKPDVDNKGLRNIVKDIFKDGSKVGNGSTGAAVREELLTGKEVGGKFHSQKARQYIRSLEKWFKNESHKASASDQQAAKNMLQDLQNALKGK